MNAPTVGELRARVEALGHRLVHHDHVSEVDDPGLYVVDIEHGRFAITPTGHGVEEDLLEVESFCERSEREATQQRRPPRSGQVIDIADFAATARRSRRPASAGELEIAVCSSNGIETFQMIDDALEAVRVALEQRRGCALTWRRRAVGRDRPGGAAGGPSGAGGAS